MRKLSGAGHLGIIWDGRGMASACHVGHMEAICELGLHKNIVYGQGCSGGAFNGAEIAIAQTHDEIPDRVTHLKAGWKKVDERGSDIVFGLDEMRKRLADVKRWLGKVDLNEVEKHPLMNLLRLSIKVPWGKMDGLGEKVREFQRREGFLKTERLDQFVVGFKPELLLTSCMRFEVSVFNRDTGELEILSIDDFKKDTQQFWRVPVASASPEPFFPSVKIGKYRYADARAIDETSLALNKCDAVIVCMTHPEDYKPENQTERMLESYNLPVIIGNTIYERAVHAAWLDAEKLKNLKYAFGKRPVVCLYTSIPKTLSDIYCEKGDLRKAMQMARESAIETLRAVF
ncbi:MAG: hypothetical protein Q7T18_05225 [Sedimentisphaerales bacterium]|nr:hypothetical protein [Sedimentisphaerales bacterium]